MMKKHPKAQGETRVEKGLGKSEIEVTGVGWLKDIVQSIERNIEISLSRYYEKISTQTLLVPSHSG